MFTTSGALTGRSILRIVILLTLAAASFSVGRAKASISTRPMNTRFSGQAAYAVLDDGVRYLGLSVMRDENANTTLLTFGYRFPHPDDPNLTVIVTGTDVEIANSAFDINSSSAQLSVTTPDSFPITRCVMHNETGDFTCELSGPSTFDLVWTVNDTYVFERDFTLLETSASRTVRTQGRLDEVTANVSGTWDEHSGMDMPGFLTESRGALLLREKILQAEFLFFSPLTVQSPLSIAQALMGTERVDSRSVFNILYDDAGGVNGFVEAWQDDILDTTNLQFGYAYPDPNDPSRMLTYMGYGEIPDSAFSINSDSARLTATTPDSFTLVHCIITGIVGPPGTVTCYPPPTSVTFDLTWDKDGSGSTYETLRDILTEGPVITKLHRQYNTFNTSGNGTWRDVYEHAGTNMFGFLNNIQSVTLTKGSP